MYILCVQLLLGRGKLDFGSRIQCLVMENWAKVLNPRDSENSMQELGESSGAYIIQYQLAQGIIIYTKSSFGLTFQNLWMVHLIILAKQVLGEQIGSANYIWPVAIHGHIWPVAIHGHYNNGYYIVATSEARTTIKGRNTFNL